MLTLIVTILTLLLAPPAWAAVVCGNETQDGESPPAANPQTTAYTPDAGSNRIVIVAVTMRDTDADNTTIDSVSSSAGGTWTQYGTATASAGADFRTSIFYSTDFADGAQTLSTTYSTTVLQGAVTVYTCTGINTASPWRGVAVTATGTATTATVDVTSTAANDLVIDALNAGQLDTGISPTLGSGQTSMYNYATGGDNLDNGGSTEPGTGGTVTMSWTSLTGVNAWSMVAGALRPTTVTEVTYYAGAGGNDSNNCTLAQSIATRKLTWASVKTCITLPVTQPVVVRLTTGSNFTEALNITTLTGTQANPITIMANSGPGTVTFTAPYFAGSSCRSIVTGGGTVNSWITLQDMTWDGVNCPDEAALVGNRLDGVTNFTMRGIEIKAFRRSALYITFNATNVLIENSNFHDQVSPTCQSTSRYYGIYIHDATNVTIRNSIFSGNPGGGLQIYPGPLTNITVTNNLIYGNSECPGGQGVGGIIVATDSSGGNISGVTIAHNLIYGNGSGVTGQNGGGIRAYATGGRTLTGLQIVNNTIYNNQTLTGAAYGINIQAGPSGAVIKNNIVLANESGQIVDAGTGTVSTTNKTTGTITDCTVSTTNFTHKAGSSCIGQGTAASGFAYNGSAPDQGAFETFGFTSAGITGNTLDVQLGMNLNIPVLPATGQTTWTVGCTGVGCGTRTVTAAAKKSGTDSVVSLTVDGAVCTDVQTWTVTYAVGTVTDSALVGNSLNQNMTAFATQAVTNNCGTPAATGTLEQKTHQFTQSQTPGNPLGAVGAASTDIRTGTSFALVTQMDCTVAACDPIGLRLYYRKNAGAYQAVPDILGDEVAFLGATSDPAYLSGAIACCLTGALTPNTGTTGFTSAAVPVFTLTQNSSIVQRRQLIVSPNAFPTDTYEFKEYNQTGVVLGGGYTPAAGAKITVSSAPFDAPTGLHLAAQQGANVGLVWTPSTDTALLGYRLYQSAVQGVQGTLVETITPASAAATYTPITTWHGHLTPGTWYFLVTQFDTGGQESPIPPELTVVVPSAIARTARTP